MSQTIATLAASQASYAVLPDACPPAHGTDGDATIGKCHDLLTAEGVPPFWTAVVPMPYLVMACATAMRSPNARLTVRQQWRSARYSMSHWHSLIDARPMRRTTSTCWPCDSIALFEDDSRYRHPPALVGDATVL